MDANSIYHVEKISEYKNKSTKAVWQNSGFKTKQSMVLFIVFICIFFVAIPTYILPNSQKHLRNSVNYNVLFVSSILIIMTTIFWFDEFVSEKKEELAFIALSPITFLILHKITDLFWQKKYNRHIYFYQKYSQDYESQESTWTEFCFQFLIFIIPFMWITIGNLIFK